MSGERLERVKSFDELRAGMIVVVKRCFDCNGNHRGMLLARVDGTPNLKARDGSPPVGWKFVPPSPGDARNGHSWSWFHKRSIGLGKIYRVVDPGLESSDEYRRSLAADEDLAKVRAYQRTKERQR